MGIVLRIVGVLVLVLALGGVGLYVAAQQTPGVAQGLKEIAVDPQAAQSLDRKLEDLQKKADEARKSGQAVPVTVTLTEQELTSKASEALAGDPSNPLHPTNVQVHLQGGNVILTSTVQVQGFSLNLAVVATPTVVDGKTQLSVKEIQTGALPVPDAVKQQINAQFGQSIDPASLGLPLSVSAIQVANGQITLQGTTK